MNHEEREGHEVFKPFSMRLPSPLSAEAAAFKFKDSALIRSLCPSWLKDFVTFVVNDQQRPQEAADDFRKTL